MSAYSDFNVQKAIHARLAATPAVTSLLSGGAAGVHDHVPAASGFPYIVIGEVSGKPLDTSAGLGRDLDVALDVYSQKPGFAEARQIMAAVHGALHDVDFAVEGQVLVLCLETGSSTALEQEGRIRRGRLGFRVVTEPAV